MIAEQSKVVALLDEQGFLAKYDFVYLPIDFKNSSGLGYAFVNMVSRALGWDTLPDDGWNQIPSDSHAVCIAKISKAVAALKPWGHEDALEVMNKLGGFKDWKVPSQKAGIPCTEPKCLDDWSGMWKSMERLITKSSCWCKSAGFLSLSNRHTLQGLSCVKWEVTTSQQVRWQMKAARTSMYNVMFFWLRTGLWGGMGQPRAAWQNLHDQQLAKFIALIMCAGSVVR